MRTSGQPIFAAALFAVLATTPLASAEAQTTGGVTTLSNGVLKVCLYFDVPPIARQVDGDTWTGWDVGFLSGFAKSLDLKFEPIAFTYFDGLWKKSGEGVCDITGSGLTDTEERRKETPDAVWSDDYFTVQRSFIVRDDDRDSLKSVGDLANRTVIVWPNSAGAIDLQRRIDRQGVSGVTVELTDTAMEALESVHNGNAFAFGWDLPNARFQAAQVPGLSVTWAHPMMSADGSEANEKYSYVVRKADKGLVEALNAYIAENRDTYGWPQ